MIVAAIAILFLICRQGETLQAPSNPDVTVLAPGAGEAPNVLLRVLVALTAVIIVGLILAKCFAYLGQPPVIGEVIAGILLGPSLLGPEASALILPTTIAPFLGVIAQLGVILYMFTVGLSLQGERLKHRARAAVAISHASIVVPFLLGALLALYLYPALQPRGALHQFCSVYGRGHVHHRVSRAGQDPDRSRHDADGVGHSGRELCCRR